ncbi:MAG: hydrogenase maturation peptidase HycI [Candidatus Bathyarchaeales archaeon]
MTLLKQLETWLHHSEKIVILGVGNPLRGDDAVGTQIVRQLQGKVPNHVSLIPCETVPENFTGKIIKLNPTHVLIIDSAEMNESPGTIRLSPATKIAGLAVSTHNAPLSMLTDYLKHAINPKMALLGIQPKQTEFNKGLSEEAQKASDRVVMVLERLLNRGRG